MHRSKVTVSARPLVSNQTEENHHRHHADLSFYFAVVKLAHKKRDKPGETTMGIVKVEPGRTLAHYDLTPPTCSVLCMDQCLPGDCQGWTARVGESLHVFHKIAFFLQRYIWDILDILQIWMYFFSGDLACWDWNGMNTLKNWLWKKSQGKKSKDEMKMFATNFACNIVLTIKSDTIVNRGHISLTRGKKTDWCVPHIESRWVCTMEAQGWVGPGWFGPKIKTWL